MTLSPDYWYPRGFDPKARQDSFELFGFMSYDLHGSWDTDTKTLGSIIRPQIAIRDIDQDLLPLWFDGVDSKKVNFGLAYYDEAILSKIQPALMWAVVSLDLLSWGHVLRFRVSCRFGRWGLLFIIQKLNLN